MSYAVYDKSPGTAKMTEWQIYDNKKAPCKRGMQRAMGTSNLVMVGLFIFD
jgi:hypothetical protein